MRDIYRFVVLHKSCHSHFAGRSSVPWKEWWPWETLICEVQVWVDSVERMRAFGSFLCPRVNIWFWMHKWITDKESPKGIEKWSGFIWFPWILAGVRVWYTICRNPEIEFWLKKLGLIKKTFLKSIIANYLYTIPLGARREMWWIVDSAKPLCHCMSKISTFPHPVKNYTTLHFSTTLKCYNCMFYIPSNYQNI